MARRGRTALVLCELCGRPVGQTASGAGRYRETHEACGEIASGLRRVFRALDEAGSGAGLAEQAALGAAVRSRVLSHLCASLNRAKGNKKGLLRADGAREDDNGRV